MAGTSPAMTMWRRSCHACAGHIRLPRGMRQEGIIWLRQVAPAGAAAFLHCEARLGRMHPHATKCMFGVESLLPRNDTAITHFSALNRQGELFH